MATRADTTFLTAAWRNLVLVNFRVDAAVLTPLVPRGTELDAWEGATYASLVCFLFEETRVLGVPVPFHGSFEEVNLRFYVRRHEPEGWRRGVVFVREFVPRRLVAAVANAIYGESYVALPMSHSVKPGSLSNAWEHEGREHRVHARAGAWSRPEPESEAEFLTGHSWGYTAQRGGATTEYRVHHPPWRVVEAESYEIDWEPAALYGAELGGALAGTPSSVLVADGSLVEVYSGHALEP